MLWRHSTIARQARCGRSRQAGIGEPAIHKGEDGVAHLSGLQLCGAIHTCPVCSPKIRQRRAEEVDTACDWWLQRHWVGSVHLLTLTMPHGTHHSLRQTLGAVKAGFARLVSGRGWQDDKADFGVQHYIRAHDATHGKAGWHPHLHVLVFTETRLTDRQLRDLKNRLYLRWAAAIRDQGFKAPNRKHGVDLVRARSRGDVAKYVMQVVSGEEAKKGASVALELTRGDLKAGRRPGQRTPWEILADFADTGDCADVDLWKEWERETRGVRSVMWSRGLKKLVGLQEQTDEDIAEEHVGGEEVYRFGCGEWKRVIHRRGAVPALLAMVEQGGTAEDISAYIRAIPPPKHEMILPAPYPGLRIS